MGSFSLGVLRRLDFLPALTAQDADESEHLRGVDAIHVPKIPATNFCLSVRSAVEPHSLISAVRREAEQSCGSIRAEGPVGR